MPTESEKTPLLRDDIEQPSTNESTPPRLKGPVRSKRSSFWNRPNRCLPSFRNGPCCLTTSLLCLLALILCSGLLFYFVIVPQVIQAAIARTPPPLHLYQVSVERIYPNETIAVYLNAAFDVPSATPSMTFLPSSYAGGFRPPSPLSQRDPSPVYHLASVAFGEMVVRRPASGLVANFRSIGNQFDKNNTRYALALALKQVEQALLNDEPQPEVEERKAALVLDGFSVVNLFGLNFPRVALHYEIGMNFDTRQVLLDFAPRIEECTLQNGPMVQDCKAFLPHSNMYHKIDGGDDTGDGDEQATIPFNVTVSICNPTFFSINLGFFNSTIHVPAHLVEEDDDDQDYKNTEDVEVGWFSVTNLVVPFLDRSKDKRHNLTITGEVDARKAGSLAMSWFFGKDLSVIVHGSKFRLGDNEKDGGRLVWFEELLHDISMSFRLPKRST